MIRRKKGFTMVELIVVIAIVAIIAAVAAPTTIIYINKARVSTAASEINNLYSNSIDIIMSNWAQGPTDIDVSSAKNKIEETLDISTVKYVTSIKFEMSDNGKDVKVTLATQLDRGDEDVVYLPENEEGKEFVGLSRMYPKGGIRLVRDVSSATPEPIQSFTLTIVDGTWGE